MRGVNGPKLDNSKQLLVVVLTGFTRQMLHVIHNVICHMVNITYVIKRCTVIS